MDGNGEAATARAQWRSSAVRGTGAVLAACVLLASAAAAARPPQVTSERIPGPVSSPAAGPAHLWVDGQGRWIHQDAQVFNIFIAARTPDVVYWVTRAARQWSARTVLRMQVVGDPSQANVVVREGHYGRRTVIAWTRVCPTCASAYVSFNLDQLARVPDPGRARRDVEAIACHELGHVAGLGHGGGDCMSFTYQRTYTLGVGAANARLIDRAYQPA